MEVLKSRGKKAALTMAVDIAYDAVVVGAGPSSLVAAAYLARAGVRVLVVERRDRVGGVADTIELAPGVAPRRSRRRSSPPSLGRPRLGLRTHGLSLVPDVRSFAPQPDGRASPSAIPGQQPPARAGRPDAERYVGFDRLTRSIGRFLAGLNASTPPDVKSPGVADVFGLRLGRRFRGLGKGDARSVLRVLPMAIADFVAEAFDTDALRGVLAARGIHDTAMGPWSAGTAAVFLNDSAGNDGGAAGQTVFARGGPGALSKALAEAVRTAGGEIRTDAEVAAITTVDGRATGVRLASGEEIGARIVVAGTDPKRVLTTLLDPVEVGPGMRWRAANIRTPGTVASIGLALRGLPRFGAAGDGDDAERRLRGRIVIAPGIDHLERAFDAAKYGQLSADPTSRRRSPRSSIEPGRGAAPGPRS
jgi:phytoene dehydrogenase-like protein